MGLTVVDGPRADEAHAEAAQTAQRHRSGGGLRGRSVPPRRGGGRRGEIAEHLASASTEPERPVELEGDGPCRLRASPRRPRSPACAGPTRPRVHSYGKAYRDIVRAFRSRWAGVPAIVAHPRDGDEAVLDGGEANATVIPFGGGASIMAGWSRALARASSGAVSLDLRALDRVLEVDRFSLSARIQAGAVGPDLKPQLGERLVGCARFRRILQAARRSAAGSPPARAGATVPSARGIDDLVESIAITGTLGVAATAHSARMLQPDTSTRARARGGHRPGARRPRPTRRSASVRFPGSPTSTEAVRAISGPGALRHELPADQHGEAAVTMAGDGTRALLVLGFEAHGCPSTPRWRRRCDCADHGGTWEEQSARSARSARGATPSLRALPARHLRQRWA